MNAYPSADEAFRLWCERPGGGTSLRDAFMAGFDAARQPTLFDKLIEPKVIPSRTTDPVTSHKAAAAVTVKANTQRGYLLQSFASAWLLGHFGGALTDEEAMESNMLVSPRSEYSKRCSELREAGLIEPTGETRTGASGHQRIVSRITDAGRKVVASL